MIKTTKDFRFSKRNKTIVALSGLDKDARGVLKRALIDAQASAEKADLDNKRAKSKDKKNEQ
jgi:hypothetical protein